MCDFSHGFGSASLSFPVMAECHATFHFRSFDGKSTLRFRESFQRN